MEINRRRFAAGLVAYALQPAISAYSAQPDETRFAANIRERDGSHAAVAYSTKAGLLRKVQLPGRGHDLAYNRQADMLVAFARRPGNFAVAFNVARRFPPRLFTTPPNRHFYGHGVFSQDGRLLYATENDFENSAGMIGVYDVGAGFRRIGEHSSYGIGPHDLNLLSDGRTLVVANGGIETHPDSGREPLNIWSMTPSLAYIDAASGSLLERHELTGNRHKLSIRHLDVAAGDTIVFGCQFKGPKSQPIELVGFHKRDHALEFLPMQPRINRALRQYVSSITVDRDGEIAGMTSSRGQQVIFVDIRKRSLVGIYDFRDVSGISARVSSGFILTGGHGDVATIAGKLSASNQHREPWAWDNHAIAF